MEFIGTKGEKWVSERVPQGVHLTIGPVENLLEDGIVDMFTVGLSYTSVTQSIKAIESRGVYTVSDKSARVGSSDGQIYIELNLLHRPGTYYRNSLGLEESEIFLAYLKDIASGKSTSVEVSKKVGRNEPCPCGSGKKYKRCCESKKGIRLSDKLAFVKDIQDENVSQLVMNAERDPRILNNADFWGLLGCAIGDAGAHKQAEEAFCRALNINPDCQDTKMNLVAQMAALGEYSKALDLIESLPDNTSRKALFKANILCELERYDDAIYAYEKAIAEEPAFALPYVSILHCLRITNNSLLEFWIERARKSLPENPEIALAYAQFLYETDRLDQLAEADWIDNLEAKVDADSTNTGREEDESDLIACVQLWREIGYVFRDNDVQHLEQAIKLLEILGPKNPVRIHARILTVLASNLGKPDAVERSFKWIHEICRPREKGCQSLEVYLGVANCKAGNYEDAVACFEALKAQSEDKTMLCNYWWSLDEIGRIQEAIQVAERLYNIDPTIPELEYNLGYLCGKSGDLAAAMEYYKRQTQSIPGHCHSLENISLLALLNHDIEDAINFFDQVVSSAKQYSAPESWIDGKRDKFNQLRDLARSTSGSKSYSRDILIENNTSEIMIGADKTIISRHLFSLEDAIDAMENPQKAHSKEVLRQHKAFQRGDRSVVISILADHIPAWDWLPPSSQDSLVESEMRFNDGQAHDYAPVVVGFAKAVEVTLKHKIFDIFKEVYAEKTHILNYTQIVLEEKDSKVHSFVLFVEKGRHLELGGMVLVLRFCTGKTAKRVPLVARFRDFISHELDLPQFLDKQILDKCDSLSVLRNPAAHEVTHDHQTASEARDLAFDILGLLQK
jgi:tetratricopeptide (TPR) repeat protein